MPRSKKYPGAIDVEAIEKPKKRKRRKDAKRRGDQAAPSKTRRREPQEAVEAPPKPRVWLRSGWCGEAHATASPAVTHAKCKHVTETPTAIAMCPCLCHTPGVLDLLDAALKAAAKRTTKKIGPLGLCPKCDTQGAKVKRDGVKMWRCPSCRHRWAR